MKIVLLKEHEHAGHKYPVGAQLNPEPDTANWLIERGVARAASVKSNEPKRKSHQQEE